MFFAVRSIFLFLNKIYSNYAETTILNRLLYYGKARDNTEYQPSFVVEKRAFSIYIYGHHRGKKLIFYVSTRYLRQSHRIVLIRILKKLEYSDCRRPNCIALIDRIKIRNYENKIYFCAHHHCSI